MQPLKDIQSETDDRNVPIDRVGVKKLRFPLGIRQKDGEIQSTVSTVSLAVDLPREFKGTHMSRFVEVLNAHGKVLDLKDVTKIPRELLQKLEASKSHVEFKFPFFISKEAPISKKPGLIDYEVSFEIEAQEEKGFDFILTIYVPVATLCPCSKEISEQGAHNQRGLVTFSVRFSGEPVWIEDLARLVEDSASCELYSVLKRPDEKQVTEEAYDNPVFVEDLVRNIAVKANEQEAISWYRVEAENFESIHNHNAYAIVEKDKSS